MELSPRELLHLKYVEKELARENEKKLLRGRRRNSKDKSCGIWEERVVNVALNAKGIKLFLLD